MESEESKEDLVHCMYFSLQSTIFSEDDIVALLEKARKKNNKLGVTGILLYDKGAFFQIVEGNPEAITSLINIIQRDTRHERFVKIIYEDILGRSFSDWTMGYSGAIREDLISTKGLNDFFEKHSNCLNLEKGRAKTILQGFKDGKWRSSLN